MLLDNDEQWLKLQRLLTYSLTFDVDAAFSEIETLHAGRKTRALNGKTFSAKRVISASLQDQSYRSRLIELLLTTTRQRNMLEAAYKATLEHALIKYRRQIEKATAIRTQADRTMYIKSLIGPGIPDRVAQLASLVETINYVVQDIDQAGWSLKRVLDALQSANKVELV
jgi:hypothetical protein